MINRVDIDDNFNYTEDNALIIHTWKIYRNIYGDIISIPGSKASGCDQYCFTMDRGSVFLVNTLKKKYAYFRHKEFQDLVDKYNITNVRSVKGDLKLDLECDLMNGKSFTIYSDGDINIDNITNIEEGTTHHYNVSFTQPTWALIDMCNGKYSYREFISWHNPHKILENIVDFGKPKFATL